MKVAFINTVAGFNAVGRMCEDLANTPGITGKIFFGRKEYSGNVDNLKFTHLNGNIIHVLSTFIFDNHAFINSYETHKLVKQLELYNPDVVHLHNLHGYYIDVKVLFKYLKEREVKVIWTLHDCWAITGHCAHFDSIGCTQWKSECKNCPLTLNYPPSFNKHNVSKNFKRKKEVFTSLDNCTIVTPSSWLAEIIKESYLSTYPIKVINNGIDLNLFKSKDKQLKGKIELLAVASVWTKNKGLKDLIQLSKLLDNKVHLTIVGLNNKQIKSFNKNVTCYQRTNNREELVKLYQQANYFINFTYEDTFPTVNIEALACGTPVITYNTGGSAEIIDDNTGIVINKGDYKKVIEIVKNTYNFDCDVCTKRAQIFSKTQMINCYKNIYLQSGYGDLK